MIDHISKLRPELRIIAEWIKPGSRVLDLGCGAGELLAFLQSQHNVTGYGIEIEQRNIVAAIKNNVNVIQADLDQGLTGFDDNSFDYVVMMQTLQAIHNPDKILMEMLRVGHEGIITFPNFGYWKNRLQVIAGHMPVTSCLPDHWYNSPNIHLCTLSDFEYLCQERNFHILERNIVDRKHRARPFNRLLPNLLGEIALYRFEKD